MKITVTFEYDATNQTDLSAMGQAFLSMQKIVNADNTPAAKAVAAEAAAPKAAPKKTTPAAPSAEGPTISEVRTALSKKVEGHRDEIKAKLSELGAANVSTLAPEKYGEMLDYLNGLV